jgi:hypothetical protein
VPKAPIPPRLLPGELLIVRTAGLKNERRAGAILAVDTVDIPDQDAWEDPR